MNYHNKYIFYGYICLIFSLSLLPKESVDGIHLLGIDKFFHLVEYAILAVLYKFLIIRKRRMHYLMLFLVAIVDEYFVQTISSRSVDHWDLIFNIIGLCLGIAIKGCFDKKN